MSIPSNGITQDVIRAMMPPYQLSSDLLEAALAALPKPPPDATPAWRQARLTRLIQEIGALMPTDAAQARIAAEILVLRELADSVASRAHAPDLTVEQVCRLSRAVATLAQTAAALERTLARRQQKPAPFLGSVLADEVDVAALDKAWCDRTPASAAAGPMQPPAAPAPASLRDPARPRQDGAAAPSVPPADGPAGKATPAARDARMRRAPPSDRPDLALPVADAGPSAAGMRMRPPAADATAAAARMPRGQSRDAAVRLGHDAGATPAWVTTRLDQGQGWTLDVVRPRTGEEPDDGATPDSVA